MELTVYSSNGKSAGSKQKLNAEIFGVEPNDHAIYLDVKQYLANQRQGTHKSKERAEITGSTRKIKKQKGTGTARAGSIKSPVFVGGGRAFGPRPRNYGFKLNKKVKQLARKSALSYKVKEEAITILDKLEMEAPKTKEFHGMLGNLKAADKKTLVVVDQANKSVYLSARNLRGVDVVNVSDLTTYSIVNAKHVIMTKAAVDKVETVLSK